MKYKILVLIIVLIALAGAVGSAFVLLSPKPDNVNIISGGKLVRTIDLSSAKDEVFKITYNGKTNTVEIKNGKIRVREAECPDHTCVKTGWLEKSGMPIVCLPNRLMIEYSDNNSGIDGLSR